MKPFELWDPVGCDRYQVVRDGSSTSTVPLPLLRPSPTGFMSNCATLWRHQLPFHTSPKSPKSCPTLSSPKCHQSWRRKDFRGWQFVEEQPVPPTVCREISTQPGMNGTCMNDGTNHLPAVAGCVIKSSDHMLTLCSAMLKCLVNRIFHHVL